jgi:hypothetical protein
MRDNDIPTEYWRPDRRLVTLMGLVWIAGIIYAAAL